LARRYVKCIDQALQGGENDDFPEVDDMRQRERGHGERLESSSGLCPHQKLAAIETFDPQARNWPHCKRNDLPREGYDAEQQSRVG